VETKYHRLVRNQQRALAIVRIFIGCFFLFSLVGKLDPHFVADFHKVAGAMAKGNPLGFYAEFLRSTVVPNYQAFAYMVLIGELVVGVSLVLGLFTAPMAYLGAFMCLNYLFATAGQGVAPVGLNLTFIVAQFALALGAAGTTWGVDRTMVDKMPFWLQSMFHVEYQEF
jgi:thiosulfate dehydrogenase [quinone] large subunit